MAAIGDSMDQDEQNILLVGSLSDEPDSIVKKHRKVFKHEYDASEGDDTVRIWFAVMEGVRNLL